MACYERIRNYDTIGKKLQGGSLVNKKLLKLYESEAGRELMILSYLSRSEAFVSIKEISQQTGLTPASIQKHIEKISMIIEELDEADMGILLTEEGVQFYARTIKQYYHLRNYLIHSSISVKLAIALLLGQKIQREQFMMTNFISEATLKRRVKELKHIFLEYNLNLKVQRGLLILKGDEAQIRKVAYETIIDLYLEGTWPFETIDEKIVTSRVESYLGMSETQENAKLFRRVKLDYGIMISRFRHQRHLKLSFSRIEPKLYTTMTQMIPKLSPFPEIPMDHALYFVMTLLANERFYETPNGQQAMGLLENSETKIAALIAYSAQSFCQDFEINGEASKMKPYLYSIHFEKLFYHYWRGAMHKKNIITPYPLLSRKLIQYVLALREKFPELLVGPLYFLTRKYMVLYGRYQAFSFYELPISIYLEDGDFPSQTELIANIYQQMFLYKYKLVFGSLEEADIIIRTTSALPPPRLAKQEAEIPTYYLNLSKPYRHFPHLDEVFQELSNKKIIDYNNQIYRNNQESTNG